VADNKIKILFEGVDKVSDTTKGIEKSLGGLTNVAGVAGKALAGVGVAIAAIGAAIGAGLAVSIKVAMQSEMENVRFDTMMKNLGWDPGAFEPIVNDMMRVSHFDDEDIQRAIGEALASGVAPENIRDYVKGQIDFAAYLGTNLADVGTMMTLMWEDPLTAMTRFRRMGIIIDQDMQARIKMLIKQGK
jgi:hypothetical protein